MPGRKYSAESGYRYGFNGKEEDDEVKGNGNEIAFEHRIYDPRIGRWSSVDAYADKYPNVSTYSYCINSPLQFKDANGHWLVDRNGNIIYTMGDPYYVIKDDIVYKVKVYYFYTNDGKAVEALLYSEKTPVTNIEWRVPLKEGGKISPNNIKRNIDNDKVVPIEDGDPEKSDCHGNSLNFLNGNPEFYVPGLDDDGNDNVSKVFKNTAEFTPVKAKDVKPGDIAIFDDGNGNIAHSATVTKVKRRGKKVKLTSKDDRNPVERNQSIKDIKKNPAYKRFVGYYRHKGNVMVDVLPAESSGRGSNQGYPDGESIKKVLEQVKNE